MFTGESGGLRRAWSVLEQGREGFGKGSIEGEAFEPRLEQVFTRWAEVGKGGLVTGNVPTGLPTSTLASPSSGESPHKSSQLKMRSCLSNGFPSHSE